MKDYMEELEAKAPDVPPSDPHVLVGNLLGEDVVSEHDEEKEEEVDILELNDHPVLTPAQFEQKWKTLPEGSSWGEPMGRVPSTPEEFQKYFSKIKIALMASSPPGQSLQRYFFYAQQALGQNFFLVEAVIDVTNKQLRVVTKVDDWSLVQQFDAYLKTCLASEWLKAQ